MSDNPLANAAHIAMPGQFTARNERRQFVENLMMMIDSGQFDPQRTSRELLELERFIREREQREREILTRTVRPPWTVYDEAASLQPGDVVSFRSALLSDLAYDPSTAPPPPKPKPAIEPAILAKLQAAEPRKVGPRVPDRIEVITGWRAWGANTREGELRLEALGQDTIWEPKKALEARCLHSGHPAPHKRCSCGIWAFETLEKLTAALDGEYPNTCILGKVSLWGRVMECKNGYRAQFAYPSELWLLNEEHEQLGYVYGVPVRTA